MLIGFRSWWAFVLLVLATALCAVTGSELARAIGPDALAGWNAVLAANFCFTGITIFLCDRLASTWAIPSDEFNRPLETFTLAVGVLAPLGAHGVSFALSPRESENVSIVAAYLIRRFPETGHDHYLQIIIATGIAALLVAVVAILLSNELDEWMGRILAIALEFFALLLLLASSLLLLPWVSVEPSSLESVSEFGGFIIAQFFWLGVIALSATVAIAILRTLPTLFRAARAAAIPTLHILGWVIAAAVATLLAFAVLSGALDALSRAAPMIGRPAAVVIRVTEVASDAAWAAASFGFLAVATIGVALGLFAVALWIIRAIPALRPPRVSAKQLAGAALALIIFLGVVQCARLFGSGNRSAEDVVPAHAVVTFAMTDVACTNATWMIRQPNRITAPVERCFPLGEADFIIAIGDATPVGRPSDEEQRGFNRAASLANVIAARYPELRGRIYALNAGITTAENSGEFEANEVRAIIGNATATVEDSEFLPQLRAHLAATWIGPHTLCDLYRLEGERLLQVENITCKASP